MGWGRLGQVDLVLLIAFVLYCIALFRMELIQVFVVRCVWCGLAWHGLV